MPGRKLSLPFVAFLLMMCLSVICCGKKVNQTQSVVEQQYKPMGNELQKLLDQQEVICPEGESCPNYLAKILVLHERSVVSFCTAYLVNSETIATTSSCLPENLRLTNADCSKDIYIFFGKGSNKKPERIGCNKVLLFSQIDKQKEVELWRDDVAFLQLATKVSNRKYLSFNRNGIGDQRTFTTWLMDQVDDGIAFIRKDICESVHNTFINPLAGNESSPAMVFAGCPFKKGNQGGPLLDAKGHVRAMISQPISESFKKSPLLIKPLQEMFHATSFACAPTIFDNEMLDEVECTKTLNTYILDRLRGEMANRELLFGNITRELEKSVEKLNRYVKFGVEYQQTGDLREARIVPKCFKKFDDWLSELNDYKGAYSFNVKLPQKTFQRAMDTYGRIVGIEHEGSRQINYTVEFTPKYIRSYGLTNVYMWNQSEDRVFPDLSDKCQ